MYEYEYVRIKVRKKHSRELNPQLRPISVAVFWQLDNPYPTVCSNIHINPLHGLYERCHGTINLQNPCKTEIKRGDVDCYFPCDAVTKKNVLGCKGNDYCKCDLLGKKTECSCIPRSPNIFWWRLLIDCHAQWFLIYEIDWCLLFFEACFFMEKWTSEV